MCGKESKRSLQIENKQKQITTTIKHSNGRWQLEGFEQQDLSGRQSVQSLPHSAVSAVGKHLGPWKAK